MGKVKTVSRNKALKRQPQRARAFKMPDNSIFPLVLSLFYFLIVSLSSASVIKVTCMAVAVLAILATVIRFPVLGDRISAPLVALALFVLMDGISTFYALSGKFALYEFLKVLLSFCLALLLLALAPGKGERPGRWIATVLAGCAALGSLVSIDLLSTRWISGLFLSFFNVFSTDYEGLHAVEAGIRMFSVFDNPNVFAGFAGIGVLLSLGLAGSAERLKERCAFISLLFINAYGFLLAFSMGASAFIALAFLVYLVLEREDRRAALFVLMLETLLLVVLAATLTSATSFQAWSGVQLIPLCCTVFGAAALCLLDHYVGAGLAGFLQTKGKLVYIIIGGLLALMVVFAFAAYHITGAATLAPNGFLRRSAYPDGGAYTLTVDADAPVSVTIESQNQQETMMHTSTILYQGDVDGAAFTVPEDSLVVYFTFYAPEGAHLQSAAYAGDQGDGKIPLKYLLLPGFIANRLQGLFANENAIQRLVFFQDGMKLFRRSPVVGLGMGSFENALMSVQSFYYQTKYAHNHYIQVLLETGVIGLLLFCGLIVISAIAVWKARKLHPLAPALGAALVFMAGHAFVEVVFSFYAYLPMAFGVFALINLCCGCEVAAFQFNRKVRTVAEILFSVLIAAYAVLLGCNLRARIINSESPTLDTLEKAIELDRFEWADYMLGYVVSTANVDVSSNTRKQADEYAERLARLDSNSVPYSLAEYYFATSRFEEGVKMLEKYIGYKASDASSWQRAFDLLERYAYIRYESEAYQQGVLHLVDMLDAWTEDNMGDISLNESTLDFIERMRN